MPLFIAITFRSYLLVLMVCSERFGCTKVIKDPTLALKELETHEAEDDTTAKQSKCLFEEP